MPSKDENREANVDSLNSAQNSKQPFEFADERTVIEEKGAAEPWKLLIVDDDDEIHKITKIVLAGFNFEHRTLLFLHAYSGLEAKKIIEEHPDIALILLDVVMETDDSGLQLVKYIRETVHNGLVRIILRTGQPGQAPEQEVLKNYDINDYKEKTELTTQKLVTSIISSLRAYIGILTIAKLNDELEQRVLQRTAELEESLNVIKEDQEAGRKIQFKLLPKRDISIGPYAFTHKMIPSLYLSGDFLDYFRIDGDHIGFYIADVSGHGASSAFVTILLKSFIGNFLDKYESEGNDLIISPAKLLGKLNTMFIEEELEKHLTFFYGVLDTKRNQLLFSNGGQYPFPMLFDGDSMKYLDYKGFPVGLLEFTQFTQHEMELPERFLLLFLSDGVLEILPDQVEERQQEHLNNLIDSIDIRLETVIGQFVRDETDSQPDDLTFLMIKRGGDYGR